MLGRGCVRILDERFTGPKVRGSAGRTFSGLRPPSTRSLAKFVSASFLGDEMSRASTGQYPGESKKGSRTCLGSLMKFQRRARYGKKLREEERS